MVRKHMVQKRLERCGKEHMRVRTHDRRNTVVASARKAWATFLDTVAGGTGPCEGACTFPAVTSRHMSTSVGPAGVLDVYK